MPAYELSLLLKNLPKQDLAAALKRVGTLLLDHGVVLQNLQNLGTKNLPYRIKKDEVYHYKGRLADNLICKMSDDLINPSQSCFRNETFSMKPYGTSESSPFSGPRGCGQLVREEIEAEGVAHSHEWADRQTRYKNSPAPKNAAIIYRFFCIATFTDQSVLLINRLHKNVEVRVPLITMTVN
ncbi:28S ribosomal protein S6 like protein [Argiope bruennichi]|uniref:Small ribosomal subunit protein bS6m n=1 Tax=Argiope bruennichi TaxID=94029 RepID=A0A8T0EUJ8_ARGBR|nr:28S ribosomal protein S6 like protein [Argiope bruennichi]